jgi:hypothetical protein
VPHYTSSSKPSLKGIELCVLVAAIIGVSKTLYIWALEYLVRGVYPMGQQIRALLEWGVRTAILPKAWSPHVALSRAYADQHASSQHPEVQIGDTYYTAHMSQCSSGRNERAND